MNYDNHHNPQFNQSEATSEANNKSEATSTEQPAKQPAQRKRLTDEQKLEKLRAEVTALEEKVDKAKTQKKILLGSALINYVDDVNVNNQKERINRVLQIIDTYITRDIDKQRLNDFVNDLKKRLNPQPAETAETAEPSSNA